MADDTTERPADVPDTGEPAAPAEPEEQDALPAPEAEAPEEPGQSTPEKPAAPEPEDAEDTAPADPDDGISAADDPGAEAAPGPAEPPTAEPDPSDPATDDQSRTGSDSDAPSSGRQRLVSALWPPRISRAQAIVAVLLFALGVGLAFQVRDTDGLSPVHGARQSDLVRILDELDSRNQRLQDDRQDLENQRTDLRNSSDRAAEARRQTEQKTGELGVLAGNVAASGPGITLTISDPGGHVRADMLLDTLQELRAAGAEAIEINKVRVVADTYFTDDLKSGGVVIDGHRAHDPYRFRVIGNPKDLEPALNIPGGVVQSMEKEQAKVSVVQSKKIIVDALRQAKQPDYARSAPK